MPFAKVPKNRWITFAVVFSACATLLFCGGGNERIEVNPHKSELKGIGEIKMSWTCRDKRVALQCIDDMFEVRSPAQVSVGKACEIPPKMRVVNPGGTYFNLRNIDGTEDNCLLPAGGSYQFSVDPRKEGYFWLMRFEHAPNRCRGLYGYILREDVEFIGWPNPGSLPLVPWPRYASYRDLPEACLPIH